MPDVLITDEVLIADATRKAKALGLNSFVIWNFTYGKLYVANQEGVFVERKTWSGTSHIVTREDVMTYKNEWVPIIKDIVLTVNEYLVNGTILMSSIENTISEGLVSELIQKNRDVVAEQLAVESAKDMMMERRLNVWWKGYSENYDKEKDKVYIEYAKNILLNWTNRITFANIIKKFHNCAYDIQKIDYSVRTDEGNVVIDGIIRKGDFFNILNKIEYNECIPGDTWIDIVDYNQFLISNNIEHIEQSVLQDILEKTVSAAKREIRGQYATPYKLADILCQLTVNNWEGNCADFCAGTGTIAKAILKNKEKRLKNKIKEYKTTWISDKYAYPLQIANKSINYMPWYQMPSSNRADLVTSENPDKRLFVAELEKSVIVDQRLIAMRYKKTVCNKELVFALINSIYGMFAIEANGFGRGQGVLDISKTRFEKVYMINPNVISEKDANEIIELFQKLKLRDILNVQDELEMKDREAFDRKVLQSIGCEHLYEKIKKSILSMQNTRHAL